MKFSLRVLLGVATVYATLGLASAMADVIAIPPTDTLLDPSDLHIGAGASSATCATGGCPVFGTEVNEVGQTDLSIYYNPDKSDPNNPLFVIIGIPNTSASTFANPFTGGTIYMPYPGGTTGTVTVTPASVSTSGELSSGQQLYSDIFGFNGDGSQSFTNWAAADASVLGITATEFDIFTYEINLGTNEVFDQQALIDLTYPLGMPEGTFIAALGFGTGNGNEIYTVPFTEVGLDNSGLVNQQLLPVPEPTSFSLLVAGLVAFAFVIKKRGTT